MRDDFRGMLQYMSPTVFVFLLQRTSAAPMKRLAIWLLGRSPGTLGTSAIADAARNGRVLIRREAARALQRKHAWAQLRDLLADDEDARVRRFATQRSPQPYQQRLESFLGDVTPRETSGRRAALQVAADLASSPGRPPKSPQFIRYILEHIRALVSGHAS